jgi:histidine phosphotransferase ChpT
VTITGIDEDLAISVSASGPNSKLASHVPHLLKGEVEGAIDAHGIQAYYTSLVAAAANMTLAVEVGEGKVALVAAPKAATEASHTPAIDNESDEAQASAA